MTPLYASGLSSGGGRERLVVAVPVLFVDEQMPRLKDTELRVFLAVLRQTGVIGKEAPNTWLTHAEMCRRTGRSSEAVSAAVDHLVRAGLLNVRDGTANVLSTAAERRRARGCLFYEIRDNNRFSGETAAKAKSIENKDSTYRFRKVDLPYTEGPATNISLGERQRVETEKARIRERLRRLTPRTREG